MSAAGLLDTVGLTQAEFVRGLLGMGYVVEVVDGATKKVVRRLGPMIERKAGKLAQTLTRSLGDKYFAQIVKVPSLGTSLEDTQDE